MEALIVIAVIIVIGAPIITLIMVSALRNSINEEFDAIRKKLDALQHADKSGITIVKDVAVTGKKVDEIKDIQETKQQPLPPPEIVKVPEHQPEPVPIPVKKPEPPKIQMPPRPGFFERNPDLEKFIGENLANKIGIGILVIGIGFFVKYAIDQDWINEIGRVFIGILAGGVLLGLAHRMRKTFAAFSSVLVGGGIAVLYLTIYIAFHTYQMFSAPVAFLMMVVITGFAVLFSLAYNRVELAVVALLGGFASPLMVSTGQGNYVVLLIYITILDTGMMVLAYYKKWPLINIIAYVFTVILYGTWMSRDFDYEKPGMIAGALIFATIFYFVFFAMNLVNNLKERRPFAALDFTLLLSNTFFYYAAGIYALNNPVAEDFRGLFTASLGIFNFAFAYGLYRNVKVDKNLVFLLIGLVLTFISLAAPIQLKGNYITLFWAAEAVLLLWLSQKSGIRLMKIGSYIVNVLMIISLMMDMKQIYFDSQAVPLMIALNKAYLTSLFAAASFICTLLLLKREKEETPVIDLTLYRNAVTFVAVVLVYVMNLLELRHHMMYYFPDDVNLQVLSYGACNMLFLLALLLAEGKLTVPGNVRNAFAFIGVLAVVVYVGGYYKWTVSARYDMMMDLQSGAGFVIHYILVALLIPVCAISIAGIKHLKEFNLRTSNAYSWFYVAFFVFLASSELDNLVVVLSNRDNMEHTLIQNHKIGFPILWGVASFLLIAIGLRWKLRHLRIISLTLFLITLLKLFLVDIRGISEGGKIAAFISLGILLLIVSFMYQRLKKLLLTDDNADQRKAA